MQRTQRILYGVGLLLIAGMGVLRAAEEWKSGIVWPRPPIVTPGEGTAPPSDAIVLFDGKSTDAWAEPEHWKMQDGYGIAAGKLTTKEKFGDCQLHIEFATPAKVKGKGQGRGNNGVMIMGHYEIQILDSYENETYFDGQCGAVYKQHPPLVNASRKPGEWQTYDIFFTAPRRNEDGTIKTPAYVTVVHNGVLIQNHFELQGSTAWDEAPRYKKHGLREPLTLGYHGDPVQFRNIWIRDLMPTEKEAKAEKNPEKSESKDQKKSDKK